MSVKQNVFVSVFVRECLMMLNDVEYTTFKMFVTQMSNYIYWQLYGWRSHSIEFYFHWSPRLPNHARFKHK